MEGFMACIVASQTDGAALTNTTTATSLLPQEAKATLPPRYFDKIGKKIRVRASGRVSSAASSPGTFTFDVRFGATIVATSQAISLNTSQTNITWSLEWELTCRAVGSSGNLIHTATLISAAFSGNPVAIPASAPAVGSNFDTSASQVVDFFGTFGTANASNSITCHQFEVISLN